MEGLSQLEQVRRVLVVKPSSLGDIVHALSAVEALARRWPQWQIDWVVNPEWRGLLEGHPLLNRVVEFPRRELRGLKAVPGFWRWRGQLRAAGRYDLALDFQGLTRSGLIAWASGAKGRWGRLGLDDAREAGRWFQTRTAATAGQLHAVERCWALAQAAGCEAEDLARLPLPHLPEGTCPAGASGEGLEAGGFVVFHPYSRGTGKALRANEIEDFCGRLEGKLSGRRLLLVGRAGDAERASGPLPAGVLDLTNATSLAELCWLLRRAAAVVSVDSGPMHLAAALPVPLLALHGWSDPRRVGPWRVDAAVWKAGVLATRTSIDPALAAGPGKLGTAAVAAAAAWVEATLA